MPLATTPLPSWKRRRHTLCNAQAVFSARHHSRGRGEGGLFFFSSSSSSSSSSPPPPPPPPPPPSHAAGSDAESLTPMTRPSSPSISCSLPSLSQCPYTRLPVI
ncbi:hypothetical protein LX32DRAFT_407413 [Colletotrichum zoysiae]|uniref:Uncharacterized protein n=1 Tax=Colletotrichum zoysiae TaxID=1216348 RepID=A0AAD9HFH7_9PEZI|nr:hypothetical protein LX32DRAFT_407413 [Colletotrichum zoysiae]